MDIRIDIDLEWSGPAPTVITTEQDRTMQSTHAVQIEMKVIPRRPFLVFPLGNAVSKKSSLSHPFGVFPNDNARLT